MKISLSKLLAGWAFLLIGILFIILVFVVGWWMIFYGVVFLITGILILLNKNEDKIEKRKDLKEKEYKQ